MMENPLQNSLPHSNKTLSGFIDDTPEVTETDTYFCGVKSETHTVPIDMLNFLPTLEIPSDSEISNPSPELNLEHDFTNITDISDLKIEDKPNPDEKIEKMYEELVDIDMEISKCSMTHLRNKDKKIDDSFKKTVLKLHDMVKRNEENLRTLF